MSAMQTAPMRGASIGDYVRRTAVPRPPQSNFWEWFHFAIRTPQGPDVVVNFCTAGDPRTRPSEDAWFGCCTVLVHDGTWSGDCVRHEQRTVQLGAGRILVAMPDHRLSFQDDLYRLRASAHRDRVAVDLQLVPLAMPATAAGVRLASNSRLSWHVVPRLAASGTVEIRGRNYHLKEAPAYHDHNWGPIAAGDLSWEWGYAIPEGNCVLQSVFFVRLLDRAQSTTYMQGLFVWKNGQPLRVFRDRELSVSQSGARPQRCPTRPRECALLLPPTVVDVPGSLTVTAGRGEDWLSLSVELLDAIRIAIPDGPTEELLVIHETRGAAVLRGSIERTSFNFPANGFFEFITH